MIKVQKVPIDLTVPSDEVRFVAMQPFIVFPDNPVEPYRWKPEIVPRQLKSIERTLYLAQNGFSGDGANFTLFPEYAVPGITGATLIDDVVCSDNWPTGSVVIGGIDGLSKADYQNLCDTLSLQFAAGNAPACVDNNQWVNCCIIWVKDEQGEINKWVQPKIRPAWPELNASNNDMFCGKTVYMYESRYSPSGFPCRFLTLICFDWVASVAGKTVCEDLLDVLSEGLSDPIPLHWAFVIQHNPGVNHDSFLQSSHRFLTDIASHPFIERDNAVIIHANTAVASLPARGGNGAFSACILSPNVQVDCKGCRPKVCMQPSALRGKSALQRCHDVVFREMGECIHTFTVRVPKFISSDVTDRTFPLPTASVYPVEPSQDARLPGGPVPASVKWLNDSLDNIPFPSKVVFKGCSLETRSVTSEESVSTSLRQQNGPVAQETVNWATCSYFSDRKSRDTKRIQNADMWDTTEENALKHVFLSLTAIGMAYNVLCDGRILHACIETDNGPVQVVAIQGDTHEACRRHLDDLVPMNSNDPLLLISSDSLGLVPRQEEYLKLNENSDENGIAFYDFITLITTCRDANSDQDLKGKLDGILPKHRRII